MTVCMTPCTRGIGALGDHRVPSKRFRTVKASPEAFRSVQRCHIGRMQSFFAFKGFLKVSYKQINIGRIHVTETPRSKRQGLTNLCVHVFQSARYSPVKVFISCRKTQ